MIENNKQGVYGKVKKEYRIRVEIICEKTSRINSYGNERTTLDCVVILLDY